MAWRHRTSLKAYRRDATLQMTSILQCDPLLLKAQGFKVLVLDLDGVLTPYGVVDLSEAIEKWLRSCMEIFGNKNVFILSNKPTKERIEYFSRFFKGLIVVLPPRNKPYPDGIQQILQQTKAAPEAVLMIDDRLLTGILAAIITHTSGRYITKPLIAFRVHFLPELFFILLRQIERWLF